MIEENNETPLESHLNKISEMSFIINFINEIIETDSVIQEFGKINNLNVLWIHYQLKALHEKYFIIHSDEFIDICKEPDLNDTLNKLFDLLIELKLIRKFKDHEYLVCEKMEYYTEMLKRYSLNGFEHCPDYIQVDNLSVDDAIKWYKDRYEEDGWGSDAFCKYFNYENEDTLIIC